MAAAQETGHFHLFAFVRQGHHLLHQFHARHAAGFEPHAAARFGAEDHTEGGLLPGGADQAQAHQGAGVGLGHAHRHRHQPEAHGFAIGALEFGAIAIAAGFARGDHEAVFEVPAKPVGNPGGQQQPLHRVVALHIDVELHHVVEGVAAAGRVKHHRQGLAPAAQPQPVEVVHGLAGADPLHQQVEAAPGGAQGAVHHQAPGDWGQGVQHLGGLIEGAVPPDPAGHLIAHEGGDQAQALAQGPHAAPEHHHIATGSARAALLGQGAVGRHQGLEGMVIGQGGRQGDQAPRH